MHKKKVLLISYHFPPDKAVGALRPSKFARYLPESGYEPYVITVKDRYYDGITNNGHIHTNIFRTNMFPTLGNIYRFIKERFYSFRKQQDLLEHKKVTFALTKKQQMNASARIDMQIRRVIRSLCCLPDDKIGWLPFAFLRAYRLIKKEKIHYILTTSPPHSTHLIGFLLKKCLNIKWFADFRDPWCIDYLSEKPSWGQSRVSRYCEQRMEKSVAINADKVILVTEKMKEGYSRFYPEIDKDKLVVVANGYDPGDCSGLLHLKKYDKFTLTYTGTLYFGRTPLQLFIAMREFIKERRISESQVEIKLVGNTQYVDGISVMEMAKRQGIESLVTVSDPVPHKKALELMLRSHVLLLFAPDQYYQVPAKAYEYMASGSYIIAFAGEGATKDLIDNYEMGMTANPDNVIAIKDAIVTCYKKYMKADANKDTGAGGIRKDNNNEINRFSMRELTRKLVSVIQQ